MKLIILLGIVLLLLPLTSGLGIGPGETEIIFEPGLETSINILITNEDGKEKSVSIVPQGDLAKYIEAEDSLLEFEEGQRSKTTKAKITLPSQLPPGPNTGQLVMKEKADQVQGVTALLSVSSRIIVFVPYPGKFLRMKLAQTSFDPENMGNFIIETENLGQENIEDVIAKVRINGETVQSQSQSLNPRESKFFIIPWETKLRPGVYNAQASVYYGSRTINDSRDLSIGEQKLKVRNIRGIVSGQRHGLNIGVVNDWNRELLQGFAEAELKKGENILAFSPTTIQSFGPYEEKLLQAYLDTGGLEHGRYDLVIRTHFNGRILEEKIMVSLTEKGIEIGDDELKKPITLVAVILLIILALFMLYLAISNLRNEKR